MTKLIAKYFGTAGEFLEAIGERRSLIVKCECDDKNNHQTTN